MCETRLYLECANFWNSVILRKFYEKSSHVFIKASEFRLRGEEYSSVRTEGGEENFVIFKRQ